MMLSGPYRCLGPAVHPEFIKNMVDMAFYGMRTDIQRLSDFHIGGAAGKHLKYLDFPADCKVLFQSQGEYYLDPESLAMTSGLLAKKIIQTDENKGG
jgi:hypothetical protein